MCWPIRLTNCHRRELTASAGSGRLGRPVLVYVGIAAGAFLFRGLVGPDGAAWSKAPLVGVAVSLAGPAWIRATAAVAIAVAAFIVLVPASRGAISDCRTDRAASGIGRLRALQSLPSHIHASARSRTPSTSPADRPSRFCS